MMRDVGRARICDPRMAVAWLRMSCEFTTWHARDKFGSGQVVEIGTKLSGCTQRECERPRLRARTKLRNFRLQALDVLFKLCL